MLLGAPPHCSTHNRASMRTDSNASHVTTNTTSDSINLPIISTVQAVESVHECGEKQRKRGGDNDLPSRLNISRKRGVEKLQALLELHDSLPGNLEHELTTTARVWVAQNIPGVVNCLKNHFADDMDKFVQKFGLTFQSKNHQKKCKETCGKP